MMRVAVLDDSRKDIERLTGYLRKFEADRHLSIQIDTYNSSFDFLEEFRSQYDALFLDIEMPGSDGMEVAREVRSKDEAVGIIFVTNMAQYAVQGYEVNAIDFMVKPFQYYVFTEKLERALRFFKRHEQRMLLLTGDGEIHRVPASSVIYIEKEKDNLLYHTETDIYKERGSIRQCKEKLEDLPFAECTSGCLVNLEYVVKVGKDSVTAGKAELPLSRRMKKQFTAEYINYVNGE